MTTSLVGLTALAAMTGLIVGSFVNLVAMRLPKGDPVAWARSRSDCCGAILSAPELVPVFSWLAQRGRCARCRAPVAARHPMVELAGAGIGVWAALTPASLPEAILTALFGWQLLLIALVDADELWLPDRLTLPLLVSGFIAAAWLPDRTLFDALAGAAVGFASLWGMATIYRRVRAKEGLGGGDPILFGAVGAWVGWIGLPSVLLWACAAGLSWVVARGLAHRPLARDEPLPFGPFIAVGGWLTWLYGPIGLG
ncbi:A24 family peptidase [Brevundimonas sp.]|uniref:prepilin peptidase n=1 Tax=Brevundimonas sp. TaxID=1871086 RepID=UPI002730A98D|nr:A24 family peptidase [Brevundimonas sp.]MDP1913766.1 A24 family peptidase [Brevundimonas sp.]